MANKLYIQWHRPKIQPTELKELSKKNDIRGFVHVLLHLLTLLLTGFLVHLCFINNQYFVLVITLFIHGTCFSFLGWEGASHELSHDTVFSNKLINRFFLILFSFLTWNNFIYFLKSHKRHHLYTLHKGKDCEYQFDKQANINDLFWELTFNLPLLINKSKVLIENSFRIIKGYWGNNLFKSHQINDRNKLFINARLIILFHISLAFLFILTRQYEFLLTITLAPFFGNFSAKLLARSQHYGLHYNTNDFRQCSRTVKINFFLEFLYWGMNYHVEHHMFPGIPFYNLKKLNDHLSEEKLITTKGILNIFYEIYLKSSS